MHAVLCKEKLKFRSSQIYLKTLSAKYCESSNFSWHWFFASALFANRKPIFDYNVSSAYAWLRKACIKRKQNLKRRIGGEEWKFSQGSTKTKRKLTPQRALFRKQYVQKSDVRLKLASCAKILRICPMFAEAASSRCTYSKHKRPDSPPIWA